MRTDGYKKPRDDDRLGAQSAVLPLYTFLISKKKAIGKLGMETLHCSNSLTSSPLLNASNDAG